MSNSDGNMPGIVHELGRNHLLLHIKLGQFISLIGQLQQVGWIECLRKEILHALGCTP